MVYLSEEMASIQHFESELCLAIKCWEKATYETTLILMKYYSLCHDFDENRRLERDD